MIERQDRGFFDQAYFEAQTREGLPHTREVIYPLADRTARLLCRRFRPQRVLDLGCAKGFLVEALRARGAAAVFGIDISAYAVSAGATAIRDRLVVGDVQAGLPIRSASCDLVTAVDVFEHLPQPEIALREIRRVLAASGVAYLKICHPRHPNACRDPSHVSVWPLTRWRTTFREAGFDCTRVYEAEFARSAGRLEPVKAWVRRGREWALIGTPADYKFFLFKSRHG
jgi:SAM-dependent methyltransferase